MDMQEKDLSYFRLRLKELLNTSFPEKAWDAKFINQRSTWATNAYEGAFRSGNLVDQRNHIAEYILFEGLHFSKFDTVFKVVINEFDTIMSDEEFRPFAVRMLAICDPVFQQYTLNEAFADSTDYDLLYTELTGTIAIWIEEHGLQ